MRKKASQCFTGVIAYTGKTFESYAAVILLVRNLLVCLFHLLSFINFITSRKELPKLAVWPSKRVMYLALSLPISVSIFNVEPCFVLCVLLCLFVCSSFSVNRTNLCKWLTRFRNENFKYWVLLFISDQFAHVNRKQPRRPRFLLGRDSPPITYGLQLANLLTRQKLSVNVIMH